MRGAKLPWESPIYKDKVEVVADATTSLLSGNEDAESADRRCRALQIVMPLLKGLGESRCQIRINPLQRLVKLCPPPEIWRRNLVDRLATLVIQTKLVAATMVVGNHHALTFDCLVEFTNNVMPNEQA